MRPVVRLCVGLMILLGAAHVAVAPPYEVYVSGAVTGGPVQGGGGYNGAVQLSDLRDLDEAITWPAIPPGSPCSELSQPGGLSDIGTDRDGYNDSRCSSYMLRGAATQYSRASGCTPGDMVASCIAMRSDTAAMSGRISGPRGENELHQTIDWVRGNDRTIYSKGVPVAWLVRVWRHKVAANAPDMPFRGRNVAAGTDRYPVFERRMNLSPGDRRSDDGILGLASSWDCQAAGGPDCIDQKEWWNGGIATPGPVGNWWRDVERAGPIGNQLRAPMEQNICNERYLTYRRDILARNTDDNRVRQENEAIASPTLRRYLSLGPGWSGCFWDFGGNPTASDWYEDTPAKPGEVTMRESIAIGWKLDTRQGGAGNSGDFVAKIQAAPGYLYIVNAALIDNRENILTQRSIAFFPNTPGAGPCIDPCQSETGDASPRIAATLNAPLSLTAGSPGDITLGMYPTGSGRRGTFAPDQFAWPIESTIGVYDVQQTDPENTWRTSATAPDGDPQLSEPFGRLSWQTPFPSMLATAGQMRQITRDVVIAPEATFRFRGLPTTRLGTWRGDARASCESAIAREGDPVSDACDGRGWYARTVRFAQSLPSKRDSQGDILPVQTGASVRQEVGRHVTTSKNLATITVGDEPAYTCDEARILFFPGSPQDAQGEACIEASQVRMRDWYRLSGDVPADTEQLAGAYIRHTATDAPMPLKITLVARDAATGQPRPDAVTGLIITDRSREFWSPVKSLTPAEANGQWSITWCRPGAPLGARRVTSATQTRTTTQAERGDAGCRGPAKSWSWQAPRERLGVLSCPESRPGPGGDWLTGVGPGYQDAVPGDDLLGPFPWQGDAVECTAAGRATRGRFVPVQDNNPNDSYAPLYRWVSSPGEDWVCHAGWGPGDVAAHYERMIENASGRQVQRLTKGATSADPRTRLGFRQRGTSAGLQTVDGSAQKRRFTQTGVDRTDFPPLDRPCERPGELGPRAGGWNATPGYPQADWRATPDARHPGVRAAPGEYLASAFLTGGPGIEWGYRVEQMQRAGSRWEWSEVTEEVSPVRTSVFGIQPSR